MVKLFRVCTLFACLMLAASGVRAETVLRAVMHAALKLTDPHASSAYLPTWHGYMIYDTLLALDSENRIQPQMLSRWDVDNDGKTYTMHLRPNLKWSDGAAVTADDCVASIKRWAEGDTMGRTLLTLVQSIDVVDADTFRIVLTQPTDLPLRALSKPTGTTPFMMPKRVAAVPLGQPITDMTGSGPFKIVRFDPGAGNAYEKNPFYVPRDEPASGMAGGKHVYVDRVEWDYMPDALTAANALMAGEVDYIEHFPYDLLPMVQDDPDLKVDVISPVGDFVMYRFNFTQPPFNDKRIRQAAMYAINQKDVMQALVGNPKYWQTCASLWGCGTPLESQVGSEQVVPGNPEKARELLKEAHYDGTPVVMLHATDLNALSPQAVVMAEALRRVGFNVQLAAMDWQTASSRRASKADPLKGGWNIFNTNWYATDVMDPIRSTPAAANGDRAWYGWPDVPAIETLRTRFALSGDPAEQHRIADEIQRIGIDEGLYVPLGQMSVPSVYSRHLSGVVHAPIKAFWNIRKD